MDKIKGHIVFMMAAALMFLLLAITVADFVISFKEHRPPDESIVSLLAMSISGVVGIVSGYLAGKTKE
tara:strand:+ start:277 stop:480 length:204 start_codon:yes stop_codon:yes gene_type:complete